MKKKVCVSFDYEKDRQYKYMMNAWDANDNFELSFNDVTPSEIQSNSISVIKANLTKKINQADITVVLVGEDATKLHKDRREIGYDNCELLIEYRPFRYYIYLGMIVLIYGCLQMFSDIRTNKRNHNEDSLKVNLARIITSLSTICLVVAIAFKLSLWLIVLFMLITLVAGWYLHAKKLKSENVGA